MKLKNKRTGEIGYLIVGKGSDHYIVANDEWDSCSEYSSLAELNECWEDAPELIFDDWEKNGIKSELLGTIVAPEDYVAPNGKRYFTYDEAMELEEKVLKPNGWRLPTYKDLLLLCVEFGINEDSGLDDVDKLEKTLNMKKMGWIYSEDMEEYNENPNDDSLVRDRGMDGYWWSSSVTSGTSARNLFTDASRLVPQHYDARGYGFTVRCVAR